MAVKREPLPGFDDVPPSQLIHLTDAEPGFSRKGAGRGFFYVDMNGQKLEDPTHLKRIDVLAIPPAYRDVWIAPHARGHLQATGRDDRGRKQYRYHPVWQAIRNQTKFERLAEFGALLPALRRRVARDLSDDADAPGFGLHTMAAACVRLMDLTGMRVGNETYTRENESFGVTTLQQHHVDVHGSQIQFEFTAKGGQEASVEVTSRKLAEILAECEDLPGQSLFQYRGAAGDLVSVSSTHVNDYLREAAGADWVTAKMLRTWRGSAHAFETLAATQPGGSRTARQRQVVAAVKDTADYLRNRPATCREFYIHPAILESFERGELPFQPGTPADKPRELLQAEAQFLEFLAR